MVQFHCVSLCRCADCCRLLCRLKCTRSDSALLFRGVFVKEAVSNRVEDISGHFASQTLEHWPFRVTLESTVSGKLYPMATRTESPVRLSHIEVQCPLEELGNLFRVRVDDWPQTMALVAEPSGYVQHPATDTEPSLVVVPGVCKHKARTLQAATACKH